MKTLKFIALTLFFSSVFLACKKEPVHITDTVAEATPPQVVDITGVYFGTRDSFFYDPMGNGATYTIPNIYLKVDTISLNNYQFKASTDSLFTNIIWSDNFDATNNPIFQCASYSYLYPTSMHNFKSLTLKSCDTLIYRFNWYIGHGSFGRSFNGSKLLN